MTMSDVWRYYDCYRHRDTHYPIPPSIVSLKGKHIMRKCKITVYDYRNRPDTAIPDKHEVEAWCVGGDEGIKALFRLDDKYIYEANGDDGHWWIVGQFDKHWMSEITQMNQAMAEEIKNK